MVTCMEPPVLSHLTESTPPRNRFKITRIPTVDGFSGGKGGGATLGGARSDNVFRELPAHPLHSSPRLTMTQGSDTVTSPTTAQRCP